MASKSIHITDTREAIRNADIPGKFNANRTSFHFPTVISRSSRGVPLLWDLTIQLLKDGKPTKILDEYLGSPAKPLGKEYQGEILTTSKQEEGKLKKSEPTYVQSGKNIGKKNATNVITQAFRDALGKYNKQLKRAEGPSNKVSEIEEVAETKESKTDEDTEIEEPTKNEAKKEVISPFVCMGAPDAASINWHPLPMLVKKWGATKAATVTEDDFKQGRVTLQRKYDGVRAPSFLGCKKPVGKPTANSDELTTERIYGDIDNAIVVMYSRSGEPYPGSPSIRRDLLEFLLSAPQVADVCTIPDEYKPSVKPTHKSQWAYKGPFGVPAVYLDAEIYLHGKPLNWISGQARKEKDSDLLEYHVYDCFFPLAIHYGHNMTSEDRQKYLNAMFARMDSEKTRIKRGKNFVPRSSAEMHKLVKGFLDDDYEGGIIRKNWEGYQYSPNNYHSSNLIKIKPIKDSEFRIVGFTQGTKGKDVGAIIWVCEVDAKHVKDPKDKEFNAVPMDMTYKERYALFKCLSAKVTDPKNPGKQITRFERDIKRKNLTMTVVYPKRSVKTGKPEQPKAKIVRSYEEGAADDPMHKIMIECGVITGDLANAVIDDAADAVSESEEKTDAKEIAVELFYSGSPFSNFYSCKIVLPAGDEGVEFTYGSSEQRYMHMKALTFGDAETANAIMRTKNPVMQKALGRKVKNFDEKQWDELREEIMYEAVHAKFSQNADLRKKLTAVRGRFAEASPRDKIWGIGMSQTDPDAKDPANWKGLNLLGGILDKVRDELSGEADE